MTARTTTESKIEISTKAADFTRFYAWLEAAMQDFAIDDALLYKLHVVAEEAVMNVTRYAFPAGEAGICSVRLNLSPEAVALLIEDAGQPFDPVSAPVPDRPASLHDAKPGGLGITLMRQYCPEIHYARVDGHNRLTLRFPLAPG